MNLTRIKLSLHGDPLYYYCYYYYYYYYCYCYCYYYCCCFYCFHSVNSTPFLQFQGFEKGNTKCEYFSVLFSLTTGMYEQLQKTKQNLVFSDVGLSLIYYRQASMCLHNSPEETPANTIPLKPLPPLFFFFFV